MDRLRHHLVRRNGRYHSVSLTEAVEVAAERITNVIHSYGSRSVKVVYGGDLLLEPAYLLTKLVKLLDLSLDTCIRLCHYQSYVASKRQFGDTTSGPYEDFLDRADVVLIAGSNPAAHHAKFWHTLTRAKGREGTTVVTIDPRTTNTAEKSDLHVAIDLREYVLIFNAIAHEILRLRLENHDFIEKCTEGFEAYSASLAPYTPRYVSEHTSVPVLLIEELAELLGKAHGPRLVGGVALTQTFDGADTAHAYNNLGLLCGTKPRYLRGKMNVQGVHEMAQIPTYVFQHPELSQDAVRESLTLMGEDCISERYNEDFRLLYVVKEDPALSQPGLGELWGRMEEAVVIVQDSTTRNSLVKMRHGSLSREFAEVVFASAAVHESEGTVVGDERILRKSVRIAGPIGDALEDWHIIAELAGRIHEKLGLERTRFHYESAAEVFRELSTRHPRFFNVTYSEITTEGFMLPSLQRGICRFVPVHFRSLPRGFLPDEEYPYWATIHRLDGHYNTGMVSRRSSSLAQDCPEPFADISAVDAAKLGLCQGDLLKLESKLTRESITIRCKVSRGAKQGIIALPLHFSEAPVNLLTSARLSPELKDIPVKATKAETPNCLAEDAAA